MSSKLSKKTKIAVFVSSMLVAGGVTTGIILLNQPEQPVIEPPVVQIEKFRMNEDDYSGYDWVEMTVDDFNQKIENKDSFILIARNISCPAGLPLTSYFEVVSNEDNFKAYSLLTGEFKKSSLSEKIKYLPSLVIIKEGKVVDFLDAESNADKDAYASVDGLRSWIRKYIEF